MILLFLACSSSSSSLPTMQEIQADPALDNAAAADMLCRLIQQSKESCKQQGDTLTLAQHSVRVEMQAEPAIWVPGRSIGMGKSATQLPGSLTLDFHILLHVDGQHWVAFDAKGRGTASQDASAPARVEARDRGLQLWGITTGVAMVDSMQGGTAALASLGEGSVPLSAPGYRVTRGVAVQKAQAGLAGQEAAGRMILDQGRMVTALAALVPQDGAQHGMRLDAAFDPNAAGCTVGETVLTGVLEIDGQDSGRLCELASSYPWPRMSGVQGIEVFYAFTPEEGAQEESEMK